jgi:Zn-dependent protease
LPVERRAAAAGTTALPRDLSNRCLKNGGLFGNMQPCGQGKSRDARRRRLSSPVPPPSRANKMDASLLLNGLLFYLCFIPVLTFHEFAHAWVASKCGDDTARDLGRVSLNPIVHMEVIGTVVLPLLAIFLQMTGSIMAGFIIGWGKPVPVDPNNLRNPRRDDTLIALAGPAMNILLAFIMMGVIKLGVMAKAGGAMQVGEMLVDIGQIFVRVNLILAFFNMLPIPPLDGSHVIKNAINMSYETYWRLTQYGFIAIIVAINIPFVRQGIAAATQMTTYLLASVYGLT